MMMVMMTTTTKTTMMMMMMMMMMMIMLSFIECRLLCIFIIRNVLSYLPEPIGLQEDDWMSLVSPSRRKSSHLNTLLSKASSSSSSSKHDCDICWICSSVRIWFHMFTFNNFPWKDWSASKPPPTESWSCPRTKVPPCLIAWPLLWSVTCWCIWPSL